MSNKHNMDSLIEHLKKIGAYQNPKLIKTPLKN